MIFSNKYPVTPKDMDPQYRCTQNAALAYMQDTFAKALANYHVAAFDLKERDMEWLITEIKVRFIPENIPFWTDTAKVELWISEVTPIRIYTDYRIYNQQEKVFAEGTCCWNVLELKENKLVRSEEIVGTIPTKEELVLGPHKRVSFPAGDVVVGSSYHKVDYTDLDQNVHLNNRSYLDIAMSNVREQFAKNHTIDFLHIKYNQQAFLGDELKCEILQSSEDPKSYHCSFTLEGKGETCHIYTHWSDTSQREDIKTYYVTNSRR